MDKVKVAEELSEKLQQYAQEVEDGEHDNFYDDFIVDELLDMREVLHKDGVEFGRYYQEYTLIADHSVKLYDVVPMKRALSGEDIKMKVMEISSVKPSSEGKLIFEFLGRLVK